ncbi:lupus La protein homolog A [Tetranychus urticae]|uniref:HTH La-type RNA-binding domain-containing protein n=1 Tax=Tetranychus urticae TaxID=32264 RepID=T1K3H9_TETUR|nr:lupus La protein homolog A [Tetranychus urticae]
MTNTELNEKIASQMKYYFSDYNLARDKFMKEKMAEDDGWIPLHVFLTFKKLAAMTSDPQVLVESIKASATDLIEIDESGSKIRRSPSKPLPDQSVYQEEAIQKTVHIKGFPLDSTFDQLWSFCSGFGDLESLQMRKTRKGGFKGCVLAVFKDKADAAKILEVSLKYNDKELLKEAEKAHVERRQAFFNKKRNGKKNARKNEESEESKGVKKLKVDKAEESEESEEPEESEGVEKLKVEEPEEPEGVKKLKVENIVSSTA